MEYTERSCEEFLEALASKAPVPGGGGASALVGAVGAALGSMVGSLTAGKKAYAAVEEDILALNEKAAVLRRELLLLVERDAEVFAPLAKAYGLPKQTEEERAKRARVMEEALRNACSVPLEIMEKCCAAIELLEQFAEKGSKLAISDAGVGAVFCKAALQGAGLNVFVNTGLMEDRTYAAGLEAKADAILEGYCKRADGVYERVLGRLR